MRLSPPAPLADGHVVDSFVSGVAPLDDWLKRRARANQVGGAARTYVVATKAGDIVGYYALASGGLTQAEAPGGLRRNMPDPIPMAILGRLAVHRDHQRRGLGVVLLQDAVLRVRQAAMILGIRGILVHAISEEAMTFCLHHGFVAGVAGPMTLILSLVPAPAAR